MALTTGPPLLTLPLTNSSRTFYNLLSFMTPNTWNANANLIEVSFSGAL